MVQISDKNNDNFRYTLKELDETLGKPIVIDKQGAFYGAFQPNGMLLNEEETRKMINCLEWHLAKIDDAKAKEHNDEIMRVSYPEYYYGIEYHNNPEYINREKNVLRSKPKRETKGFVYFLLSETGETKIGRTKTLDDRIYHFTTKLPYDLKIISYIETDDQFALEKELHERYASNRLRGEWFAMSEFDMNQIKEEYELIQY